MVASLYIHDNYGRNGISHIYDAGFVVVGEGVVVCEEGHVLCFCLGDEYSVEGVFVRESIIGVFEGFTEMHGKIPLP